MGPPHTATLTGLEQGHYDGQETHTQRPSQALWGTRSGVGGGSWFGLLGGAHRQGA